MSWEELGKTQVNYAKIKKVETEFTQHKLDYASLKGVNDGAVTYDKQNFIVINDDKSVKYNTKKDVSSFYKNEWINHVENKWLSVTAPRSVICPILPHAKVQIRTTGSHDRFTVFTSKHSSYVTANHSFKTIFVKNGDGISVGNEMYEFENGDDTFLIIGISAFGSQPNVTVEQSFVDDVPNRVKKLELGNTMGYYPITNIVTNGDFLDTSAWTHHNCTFSVDNGVAKTTATSFVGGNGVKQTLSRIKDHKYYVTANIKTTSSAVGIDINGAIPTNAFCSGTGLFEQVSLIFNAPTSGAWYIGIRDTRTSGWDEVEFTNIIVVDLTAAFGVGNEPNVSMMNNIINTVGGYFSGTISDYITVPKIIEQHEKDLQIIKAIGITKTKDIYPIMFGVKMTNQRDITTGLPEVPRPVGWLYYHPETFQLLYADGSPDNMKYLCEWNKAVTWDGASLPNQYRPFITKDGDIIFVWRGDLLGLATGIPNVRQNPIIYPANDWHNPIEVKLVGEKPTSWLQNCGADYLYNHDVFIFGEYTRPSHINCYTWKVTKPFTDPANWRIVQQFELSGNNQTGMKHFHTASYDPFSGMVFTTTGDDNNASKVYMSRDYGETWEIVLEGQRKYSRVLNFVYTKDKIYWANDDGLHGFYSVDRGVNGIPDFSNITELYDLSGNPPTYVNCLVNDPYGILILNRFDGNSTGPLNVYFWDIESSTMHIIKEIHPVGGVATTFGFRVEACNFYQTKGEGKTVVGFGNPKNDMDLLGNTASPLNENRINNMVLEVVKNGTEYSLKISAVSDRS